MAKSYALLLSVALLAAPAGRADEPRRDWSRVQALPSGQQIVVKPFNGMGPKVKGAYVSSDADGLIVRRQNGQEATISKDRIRQVARKRRVRNTVLIGTVAGFAIGAGLTSGKDFVQPHAALLFGGICAGIGALGRPCSPRWWNTFCCLSSRQSRPKTAQDSVTQH